MNLYHMTDDTAFTGDNGMVMHQNYLNFLQRRQRQTSFRKKILCLFRTYHQEITNIVLFDGKLFNAILLLIIIMCYNGYYLDVELAYK
jgi:tRNA G37 N-methylase TrmD